MIKMIALLRRKPGMSREAFIHYYETRHVPLMWQQQGPGLIRYLRNYVEPGSQIAGPPVDSDIDVVTECHFADAAARDEVMARLADPEATRIRTEDEQRFLDTSAIRVFFVEVKDM